jgi:hypothetical protein
MQTQKFKIPEPIKSKLGFHIIMVCESQIHTPKEEPKEEEKPFYF